jgi:predicted RNase H-like nuclease (RuvC/YqgF family)
MSWWEWLLITAGGGGAFGAVVRGVYRHRKTAGAAFGALTGGRERTINELRGLLDEQRQTLSAHIASAEHLAGRVSTLETTVSDLRAALDRARAREVQLEAELDRERALSGARIAELERRLADARHRIDELETRLAAGS